MIMTQQLDHEKLLYDYLHDIAPVPPDLYRDIIDHVAIKSCSKNRNLTGQLFDMHIVLEGMVLKRREEKDIDSGGDVLDFISPGQCIFHMERIDNCYFETDSKSTVVLLDRELQERLLNQYPIFNRHLRHFFVNVLKCRSFRSKLINLPGIEKKVIFKKEYPEAYRDCAVKDKSSFLGMTPSHYSKLDI